MTELPPGWREVPLAAVAEVHLGRQRSPKNHVGDQMRPYVRAANVSWSGLRLNDVKTMNFTDSEMATYRLEPGDLLLGEASGSPSEVGKPALWRGEIADCAFQNTLIRVRPKGPDPEYLLHYFRHQALSGTFAAAARGVGIRHLGSDALAKWKVPLPSLPEQQRIAEVLDRADALRAMRRQAVDLLDALVPALYRATFAKPAGDGWPVLAMGKVIAESKIGLVRASDLLGEDKPVRYIRMNAITSKGSLNLTGVSRAHASADETHDYGLRPGDLIFNTRNTRELVGKTAIYRGSRNAHVYNNNLMRIRFTSQVVVDYIHQYLRSNAGRGELEARKSGTTSVFAIYAKDLATIPVPIPPVGLQAEFAERVGRIDRSKAVLLSQADELDVLFASLKSRAFSGVL